MNTSSTSSETAEPSGPAGKGTPAAPARRSGAASSVIMASGTLVSRALGFVKTVLITVAIGSITTVSDVFELANTLPNLIYVLVAGGILKKEQRITFEKAVTRTFSDRARKLAN